MCPLWPVIPRIRSKLLSPSRPVQASSIVGYRGGCVPVPGGVFSHRLHSSVEMCAMPMVMGHIGDCAICCSANCQIGKGVWVTASLMRADGLGERIVVISGLWRPTCRLLTAERRAGHGQGGSDGAECRARRTRWYGGRRRRESCSDTWDWLDGSDCQGPKRKGETIPIKSEQKDQIIPEKNISRFRESNET